MDCVKGQRGNKVIVGAEDETLITEYVKHHDMYGNKWMDLPASNLQH